MSNRFYSSTPIEGLNTKIDGPEAHHLLHVLRLNVGAEVVLFDGSGYEFSAQVVQAGRADVELKILDRQEVDRELPFELTIGVALPKGDRQRWLIEKLVELGVTRVMPLITERGVAQPNNSALSRLRRGVIEASKQCGRNRLAEITDSMLWNDFITIEFSESNRFVCHPSGANLNSLINGNTAQPRSLTFAVGPEGGFTDDEIALALNAGWKTASLGPRILRIETAAIAIAAIATSLTESG